MAQSPARQVLLLFAVAICAFFVGLGRLPLTEPDEGRNAEVAREMLVSGDWITPHYNTLTYLDKPVVFFWAVAASFRAFGVSEWAARFPSAFMALATSLLVWLLARQMFGATAGIRAGLVWATTPLVIVFARNVIFDMTLTFFVTVAMVSYWLAQADDFARPASDALFFGAMGIATITKGPVGFLLPLLSVTAYLALRGRLRELGRLRWRLGVPVFLVVTLPWFLAVCIRNPGFARYAFWDESLLRFATSHAHRSGGPLYYVPVFLAGLLPWSFFLLFAAWNRRKSWRDLRQYECRAHLYLLAWATVIFVFFSISRSKLPGYFLPATMPLSILMAQVWAELDSRELNRRPDWLTAGFAMLIAVGLLACLSPQLLRIYSVHLLALKKIPPAVMPLIRPALLFGGLILAGLGVLGRNLSGRLRAGVLSTVGFALLAAVTPLLIIRWLVPLEVYAVNSSSRQLARTILRSQEKDMPVYGYYYFRTSLPFYLGRPVGLVTADAGEMTSNYVSSRWQALRARAQSGAASQMMTALGSGTMGVAEESPLLIDVQQLPAVMAASGGPWLVLLRSERLAQLGRTLGPVEPMWDGWDYSVWKVQGTSERTGIYRLR